MAKVDLCGKESGNIWTRKLAPSSKDGLLFEVGNTRAGLTPQGKHMQFTRVAFSYHGNQLVVGDQHGNIYQLNMANNRFKLVHKGGQACTALVACISRPNEILVALADYSLKCIDTDSSDLVATLRGHEASVKSLSLHSSGRFALAVSSRDSVLWDLDSFARCRTLNGGQEVGVQDVFFQPMSNTIITCFKDDSIHAWETDTLDYQYQIPPPFAPTPHYRAFATPQDGRLLVAGGRSSYLHVWSLESRQLLRVVQLPPKIRVVKQLVFLPDSFDGGSSETLGFLAQDGILRFINIHSCKQLFQVGSHDQMLSSVQVSPDGCFIGAISEQGNLMVFDVATLAKELRRPPAPLVRIMDEEEDEPPKVTKVKASRSQSRQTSHKAPLKSISLVPKAPHPSSTGTAGAQRGGGGVEGGEGGGKTGLDVEKLKSILKGFGEYPAKYRTFIWRNLLQLPENHVAYSALLDKGTHPAFANLHQTYPIKSRKLLRVLQRALSTLAHWSAIFGETEYLPGMVFPFVKLCQNNQLVTFEILATLLVNWCSHWFEYFPNPPLNVLAMIENCLAHHDGQLLEHFIKHDITSHQYAWPLLQTVFSEVLSRKEWLQLWDNLFSNPPSFLPLTVVSFLTTARHTLLQCSTTEDFEHFFHHHTALDIGSVIQEAYRLQQTTPPELHPDRMLESFVPLTRGTYPVFNKYPKFIVDYQVRERERIRQEELEYLRERQSALELERMTEQRRHEEEAWYRQQQLLMEAEEQRRRVLEGEEKKLTDQRARLQALKRELKAKELQVLDATRRRFLHHQQGVREAELRRMEGEIQHKVEQRERETRAVLDDIETRALELERQRILLEQELRRCQEEMLYRLHADHEAQQHREDLEQSMLERAMEEETQRERRKLDAAHIRLAKTQAGQANLQTLQEAGARRALHDVRREAGMEEVVDRARLNHLREMQLHTLASGLEKVQHSRLAAETGGGGTVDWLLSATDSTEPGKERDEEAREKERRDRDPSSTWSSLPQDSPGLSALVWSHRREALDQQEADLLSRVRELRQKVVGSINTSASTH